METIQKLAFYYLSSPFHFSKLYHICSPLQYIHTSSQSYISKERLGPLMEKYDKDF